MKLRELAVFALAGTMLALMPGCEKSAGGGGDKPAGYWTLKKYVGTLTCTRNTATAQWGARGTAVCCAGQQFDFSISLYAPASQVTVITKIPTGSVLYYPTGVIVKWHDVHTVDWSMAGTFDPESNTIDFDFIHMHLNGTYDDNQISGTITASELHDGKSGQILFEDHYTFTATRQPAAQ